MTDHYEKPDSDMKNNSYVGKYTTETNEYGSEYAIGGIADHYACPDSDMQYDNDVGKHEVERSVTGNVFTCVTSREQCSISTAADASNKALETGLTTSYLQKTDSGKNDQLNNVDNDPHEYEELTDNIYYTIPDGRFDVIVKKTALAKKSKIVGNRKLVVESGKISFHSKEKVVTFLIPWVRKFGDNVVAFYLEIGRKCEFGEGRIELINHPESTDTIAQIRDSVREQCRKVL
ncbi:uncharacterized protein LOC127847277 [Dreissena polymorpha]|uniref:IRS-type PTB domain-containing protein n=1 Tax=Dreissena polymorpha TaxID=45954 RepID=A0A9D4DU44_DREPO|nr:uncharacterized protein LOC127847277 [Dreissena polymorpha]KAH3755293.1 hypothetical protein DPMN_189984 [Dreissena polymorpha]